MTDKRPAGRIKRIRSDYAPGYPQELTRAEFEQLLTPDHRRRMLGTVAMMAAVAGPAASASAQDRAEGTAEAAARAQRIAEVSAVLARICDGGSFWMEHTTFQRLKDKAGNPLVVPSIPISFGNSHNGVFDAERARKLAFELFEVYGLKPEANSELTDAQAEIDVFDRAQRIGVELRGQVPAKNEMFSSAEEEAPERGLDDAEHARLTTKGYRIHAADLASYPLMDGDQFTPTLAYLAGIVEFLNSVTGGPDVDLAAILDNMRVQGPLPDPQPNEHVRVERANGTMNLHVSKATKVTFDLPGKGYQRRIPPSERFGEAGYEPMTGPVHISDLVLLQVTAHPAAPMTIDQEGDRPLHLATKASAAFLPRHFDPDRPFALTLELAPGRYMLPGNFSLVGAR